MHPGILKVYSFVFHSSKFRIKYEESFWDNEQRYKKLCTLVMQLL